jgi:acyl-CoA dehydrogenase
MGASFLEDRHLTLAAWMRQQAQAIEPRPGVPEDFSQLAKALARLGCFRHLVPKAYGGEADPVEVRLLCAIREELAYRSAAADSIFAVQGLGTYPLLLGADEELRRSLLPSAADGTAIFAFALTEPEAGSDLSAISCSAHRSGDHYLLNGVKRFISNAGIASHYTLFARTAEGSKGLSTFVVPTSSPGLRVLPQRLLGEHPIGELVLDNCRIATSQRVGGEGNGMQLALSTLDVFRSTVGAAAVGMARRALDEAVTYAQKRRQFGGPLASLQGVQFLLAESTTEIDAARLLVQRAAAKKDQGAARITYEAAVAKLFATEAAQRAIDRCLQIHGANGLIHGSATERLYRDIRALRIYEGASEVLKVVIARHLLSQTGSTSELPPR